MSGLIGTGTAYRQQRDAAQETVVGLETRRRSENQQIKAAEQAEAGQLTGMGAVVGYSAGAAGATTGAAGATTGAAGATTGAAGATTGAKVGSWAGPIGAVVGAAVGYLVSRWT